MRYLADREGGVAGRTAEKRMVCGMLNQVGMCVQSIEVDVVVVAAVVDKQVWQQQQQYDNMAVWYVCNVPV